MKSKILIIYLLASISYSLHAQIKIGIRDNKFPYTSYTYKNTWGLKLEESIFSEDFAYQYIRGYLNYASTWKDLEIELSPYIGTQWNGNFQDYGMLCTLQCKFNHRFSIYGTLNPHKDTS